MKVNGECEKPVELNVNDRVLCVGKFDKERIEYGMIEEATSPKKPQKPLYTIKFDDKVVLTNVHSENLFKLDRSIPISEDEFLPFAPGLPLPTF